jgi:hypothetical protein
MWVKYVRNSQENLHLYVFLYKETSIVTVGNTGVQLTVGRYSVLVDVGCRLGS